MPRSIARVSLGLLCLCLVSRIRAADSPSPAPSLGDASIPVDLSGQVTLQNCVAQALGRNFTVRIQQFSVIQSVENVVIQQAAFEPTFGFTGGRQTTVTAVNEEAFGVPPKSVTDTGTFSLTDTVVTGGSLTASYQ